MDIFIVVSRDDSEINAFISKEKAEIKVKERIFEEEMRGGRPSVNIKTVKLEE